MSIVSKSENELLINGGGRTTIGGTILQINIITSPFYSIANLQDGGIDENGITFNINEGGEDDSLELSPPVHEGGLNHDNN